MSLSIDEIHSFVAVAESGSFSEAARRLRRAQSVVSVHISGLEAELGYKLFERTPKPVLTTRGRELLANAKRILVESQRFEARAAALHETETPSLYMGIDLVLEAPVMLDLLKEFSKTFPSVRLQIENISSSEAQWFFRKSNMKLALVFSEEPSLESEEMVLGHSEQLLVVAKNHPLAQMENPTVDDLRQYRQIVVNARDPESPSPTIINPFHWEVDSGIWALGLVARGVGWTILPKSLLIGKFTFRTTVTTIKAPFAIPASRLVLRTKKDEVSDKIVSWWANSINKYKNKLGIDVAA